MESVASVAVAILISEAIVAATTFGANHEPAGAVQVKGRSEPVRVFRVLP